MVVDKRDALDRAMHAVLTRFELSADSATITYGYCEFKEEDRGDGHTWRDPQPFRWFSPKAQRVSFSSSFDFSAYLEDWGEEFGKAHVIGHLDGLGRLAITRLKDSDHYDPHRWYRIRYLFKVQEVPMDYFSMMNAETAPDELSPPPSELVRQRDED